MAISKDDIHMIAELVDNYKEVSKKMQYGSVKMISASRIADELEQAWWNMPQTSENAKWVDEYMEPLIKTLRGQK